MKARYFFFVLTVLAVSIVSCTREDGKDTAVEGPVLTFTAIHADSKDTKTALQDNGTSIWWTSNEQINIFYGTKFKGQFSSGNTEPQATTTFSGSLTVVTGSIESGAADAYWAVYPYDEANTCDGESVTLTVPSTQTGVAGTFADNFFPAIATSTTLDLAFYNVCGGARFSVSQTGITSIKVSSKNATPIAGKVRVGFGANGKPEVKEVLAGESEVTLAAPAGGFVPGEYYYAALLPGTHSDGLDLTFEKDDNTMGTYQIIKNLEVHRAVFGKLSNLDEDLTFGPNPKVPIQFADPIAKYACVEKYDTNGDGEVSYEEAAAATSLDGLFKDWQDVKYFDEIKYFTGVSSVAYVFMNLPMLERITIPVFITDIGDYGTFCGCSSLKTVILHDAISTIPQACFYGCTNLTDVNLPSAINEIPLNCFGACLNLSTILLPEGIKLIDTAAFSGCTSLSSIILPSSVNTIGLSAFSGCTSLSSIILPPGLTAIPEGMFRDCTNLSSITWPDALDSIGDNAFLGCTFKSNNYTLELPSSIKSIGSNAFEGLRHIIIPSSAPVSINSGAFGPRYSFLYVPSGMVDMYKARTYWKDYADMIRPIDDYPAKQLTGDAIDLGLSVKWATFNVGATAPEDYGFSFAWGETSPKQRYSWGSYKHSNYKKITKYCPKNNTDDWDGDSEPDGKILLDLNDDAAHENWGGSWRMPTEEEQDELKYNCTWEWTQMNGVYGCKVSGNKEGHTDKWIFLPAAGYRSETKNVNVSSEGDYWSSSLGSDYPTYAITLNFNSNVANWNTWFSGKYRYLGLPVRPVCPKD